MVKNLPFINDTYTYIKNNKIKTIIIKKLKIYKIVI